LLEGTGFVAAGFEGRQLGLHVEEDGSDGDLFILGLAVN
jgi:hypothetical protein